ncbi:hypothetical protein GQ457_14G013920 [Hibiscus cannabinus]
MNAFVWNPAANNFKPRSSRMPLLGSCSPPQVGYVKFNTDAAVNESFGKAGIGGVLRDNRGNVLARFSKSTGNLDPSGAELLAIHEACQLANKCNQFYSQIEWEICFQFRESNCLAHQLAKTGIGRTVDLLEFYDGCVTSHEIG